MSRLSPPTEPSREWNCNLNVAWSAGKTFLFLEKMSTRNLQPTPKMISKSSVPIDLFTAGCVENLGTDPGLKLQTHNLLYSWKCYRMISHPFRSTVEVKREILAIFHILLEALQPHLSQLKYYVSRQITVYSGWVLLNYGSTDRGTSGTSGTCGIYNFWLKKVKK